MANKTCCPRFLYSIALIFFCLLLNATADAQVKAGAPVSLASLVARFRTIAKLPCGQRDEATRVGEAIVSRFGRDRANFNTVQSVIQQLAVIEKQEAQCRTNLSNKSLLQLYEEFKTASTEACGEREQALRLGKEVIDRFSADQLNKIAIDYVKKQFSIIEAEEKVCREANSLEALFEDYKILRKAPCGDRSKAVSVGEQILTLHSEDPDNPEVITYVVNDVPKIKNDDRICQRSDRYNQAYKSADWLRFFAISKEIIEEEGDSPLALDVMLTLVRVGYTLTAYRRNDSYTAETFNFAKKALELIDSGVRTGTRWGVFEPFGTKDKAQAWLNYIAGYVSYFRLKENTKAIPFFYRATQYDSEFKFNAFVYQAVAIHYFEKEAVTPSSLTINDFIVKATSLGEIDDPGFTEEEAAKNRESGMLYRQLVNLYNMRYNLAPNENATDLTDYILKLINRPLIDTASSDTKDQTLKPIK